MILYYIILYYIILYIGSHYGSSPGAGAPVMGHRSAAWSPRIGSLDASIRYYVSIIALSLSLYIYIYV